MNVTPINDQLVNKTTESGSYSALLWLKEDLSVNLNKIRNENSDGLLHQMVKSKQAKRFFKSASREWPRENEWGAALFKEDDLFSQRNHQGRTFLHELVASRDRQALELIISPRGCVIWVIAQWFDNRSKHHSQPFAIEDESWHDTKGMSPAAIARLLGCFDIEKMIDELEQFCVTFHFAGKLWSTPSVELTGFGSITARSLIQFYNDLEDYFPTSNGECRTLVDLVCRLAATGRLEWLTWLVEEEPSLLGVYSSCITCGNKDEFVQLSQTVVESNETQTEMLDLVSHAVCGYDRHHYSLASRSSIRTATARTYTEMLTMYAEEEFARHGTPDDPKNRRSLVCFISRILTENESSSYEFAELLRYKLRLLQDGDSLDSRLKTLDFLVKEKGLSPPSAICVIRWRQCGVLRWLVKNGFVNLNDEASTAIATSLRPGIPLGALLCIAESHMPLGELLCIVAVQADDLPSFQWLVESEKIPLSNNCRAAAVGMCVELGRAEVLLWMRSRGMLRALETKDGQQLQTDEKFSFVQDALKKGFTLVADILLSCEFPSHDSSGTSAASIAKQSETASVRTWGEEKERPLSLESDAERLMPPFGNMSDSHLVSGVKKHFGDALKTFASALSSLRKEQKPAWSPSDLVKNDGTLSDIQQEVKSGRISLITITHLAAVHDRKDVLQWLVEDRNMSLDARERRPASWYCWEGC